MGRFDFDDFVGEIPDDAVMMRDDWDVDNILITRRTLDSVDKTSSAPTYTEASPVAITGVFTIITEDLRETVFGGMDAGDAILLLAPGVTIDHEDVITYESLDYRVDEIREDEAAGDDVETYVKLVEL